MRLVSVDRMAAVIESIRAEFSVPTSVVNSPANAESAFPVFGIAVNWDMKGMTSVGRLTATASEADRELMGGSSRVISAASVICMAFDMISLVRESISDVMSPTSDPICGTKEGTSVTSTDTADVSSGKTSGSLVPSAGTRSTRRDSTTEASSVGIGPAVRTAVKREAAS
jgi:hypothetical protein